MNKLFTRSAGLLAGASVLVFAACGPDRDDTTDYRVETTDRQPGVQPDTGAMEATGTSQAGSVGEAGASQTGQGGMTDTAQAGQSGPMGTGQTGQSPTGTTGAGEMGRTEDAMGGATAGGTQFGQTDMQGEDMNQDPQEIEERIRQTLSDDMQLALSEDDIENIEIQVEANNSVVLSGTVPSQQDAQMVEQRVSEISGVEFVRNNLQASR